MCEFLSNLFSNLIAGSIIALIVGVYITRKLDNKEKLVEKSKKVRILKEILLDEIRHNKRQLELMVENLPIPNIVYPALETTAWDNSDKGIFFNELTIDEVKHIVSIYNRIKTINKLYYSMLDRVNWIEERKKPVIKKQFMDGLVDRCEEALTYINTNFRL